jgi:N-formylglutamate amidohydrolase
MPIPLLLSVPHAGLQIPSEVQAICILKQKDIVADGDGGAGEIYLPLKPDMSAFVATPVARAIVDMNRREDDRRKDGIVKTHTCWDVPVYQEPPSEAVIQTLIEKYHRPYHADLSRLSKGVKLGVDCHTMAEYGPPVGPDPGLKRPRVCLSNGEGTCPNQWIQTLAKCFAHTFESDVSLNHPFKGGHIIRSHAKEMPWVQLELSREGFLTDEEKGGRVLKALSMWSKKMS